MTRKISAAVAIFPAKGSDPFVIEDHINKSFFQDFRFKERRGKDFIYSQHGNKKLYSLLNFLENNKSFVTKKHISKNGITFTIKLKKFPFSKGKLTVKIYCN